MKYVLSEFFRSDTSNGFNATNKARNDTIRIAVSNGYQYVNLYESGKSKVKTVPQLLFNTYKMVKKARENDTILVQYPYYPDVVNSFLFSTLLSGKKRKKYKLYVLIHDIVFLRQVDLNQCNIKQMMNQEFRYLKNFDRIICHNSTMKQLFNQIDGKSAEVVELGPFFYLYDKERTAFYSENARIIIAGNLSKSKTGYIYDLPETGLKFNLFGVGFELDSSEDLTYYGKFPPDELINHLEGNYGLVWDGDSIDTCSGFNGNYLRFNNPHKFSLYIAAGIPLIVWKKSALANFVEIHEIGISVDSLREVKERIALISEKEYIRMVENLKRIRKQILSGSNLVKWIG